MINYSSNLNEMRQTFLKTKNLAKDKYRKPRWTDYSDHELSQIYIDLEKLYQSGMIVYACVVQMNENLFKRFPPFNYPGNIIFSTDLHFEANPNDLRDTADELFEYKNTDAAPLDLEKITNALTNEYQTLLNVSIPLTKTKNRQIYFSTIMVHKRHIPKGMIVSPIFPIICLPGELDTSVILPKKYWTDEFIASYVRDASSDSSDTSDTSFSEW